jgi:NADPH:quinone reductase-like Zn-dependent oxidoreductase
VRALAFAEFGDPSVLSVAELAPPSPGPGEVLLDVTCAGVNNLDSQVRRGESPFRIDFPFVGGIEPVGVVAALGDGVTGWRVGQRVLRDLSDACGHCRHCRTGRDWRCKRGALTLRSVGDGFGEQLVCRAGRLVALPDAIPDEIAAAIQVTYGAAWHTLIGRAHLRPGETVLVNSVCGGIGLAAADIARLTGAAVIGTASNDERAARAIELGCDAAIDYSQEDVAARVRELTDGEGADVAFDHVGGAAARSALDALAMDGRLVACGWHGGGAVELDLVSTILGRKTLIGSIGRTRDDLHRCLECVLSGALRPVLADVYELDQAVAAFTALEARRTVGKTVLRVGAKSG